MGPLYSEHADPQRPGKVSMHFGQLSPGGLTSHKPWGFRLRTWYQTQLIPTRQFAEGSGLDWEMLQSILEDQSSAGTVPEAL